MQWHTEFQQDSPSTLLPVVQQLEHATLHVYRLSSKQVFKLSLAHIDSGEAGLSVGAVTAGAGAGDAGTAEAKSNRPVMVPVAWAIAATFNGELEDDSDAGCRGGRSPSALWVLMNICCICDVLGECRSRIWRR